MKDRIERANGKLAILNHTERADVEKASEWGMIRGSINDGDV